MASGKPVKRPTRFLAPVMPREAALDHCRRQVRPGIVERIARRIFLAPASPVLERLEMLWLPTYLVRIEVSLGPKTSVAEVAVDACSGSFSLSAVADAPQLEVPEDGGLLPSLIPEDEAVLRAQKELLRSAMAQRTRKVKLVPRELIGAECVAWPIWVYYYPRYVRWLDMRGCDALNGDPLGNRMRSGIMAALVALSEAAN